jgi:hypothetical protein
VHERTTGAGTGLIHACQKHGRQCESVATKTGSAAITQDGPDSAIKETHLDHSQSRKAAISENAFVDSRPQHVNPMAGHVWE